MKIVLAGGSEQVGGILQRAFRRDHHEVVILSRGGGRAGDGVRVVPWDARSIGPWAGEIDGADVVINLAGRSVNCRYTPSNQREMMDSRVDSTRAVGLAIGRCRRPPRVWLQSSTATIYAHRFDAANDEATGIIGGNEPHAPQKWRFSIAVAKAWEAVADGAETPDTRKVLMRSAMVMSPDHGGVFDMMAKLVRWGLGGRAADGRQFVSWIHESDFVAAVRFLIDHAELSGPVNLASPNPLPYADFMAAVRAACGVKFGLPATRWMLAIGAALMGTETELVLKSRRVVPGRLLGAGFEFQQPDWPAAARELYGRWKM